MAQQIKKKYLDQEVINYFDDQINDEIVRAQAAETALGNDIDAEETRALAAESALSTSIASEVSRATSAESVLQSNINSVQSEVDAEEVRALAAEASLQSQINTISSGGSSTQVELDATQVGAGLETNGNYLADVSSHYIASATSLKNADDILDQALKDEELARSSADTALDMKADALKVFVGQVGNETFQPHVGAVHSQPATNLKQAVQYLDDAIVSVEGDLTSEVTARQAADANLQSQINNILSNVDPASIDSFTEVVAAFEAADASLNGAITSLANSAAANLANEVTRATAAEGLLDGRLDVLEAVQWYKEKFVVNSTILSNGFVTLSNIPKSNSMSAFVDRLAIHEGVTEDYSISGTTMTFLNDLVGVGNQKLQIGDTVYVKYMS